QTDTTVGAGDQNCVLRNLHDGLLCGSRLCYQCVVRPSATLGYVRRERQQSPICTVRAFPPDTFNISVGFSILFARTFAYPMSSRSAARRYLLHRPSVAVGIAEEHERAPGIGLHFAHFDAAAQQIRPRRMDIGNDESQSAERS